MILRFLGMFCYVTGFAVTTGWPAATADPFLDWRVGLPIMLVGYLMRCEAERKG